MVYLFLYPSDNLNAWDFLSVRHFVYKLLFHVHLPRFGDILIWIDFRNWCSVYLTPQALSKYIYLSPPLIFPTTSTELGQKTARCESLRALLHYVEWDRIVTLAGANCLHWILYFFKLLLPSFCGFSLHLDFCEISEWTSECECAFGLHSRRYFFMKMKTIGFMSPCALDTITWLGYVSVLFFQYNTCFIYDMCMFNVFIGNIGLKITF
jgi:hypothetical protein